MADGQPVSGAAGAGRRVRVGACLSLSRRYARFGRQAARGLALWQTLEGAADLVIEDDQSDPGTRGPTDW